MIVSTCRCPGKVNFWPRRGAPRQPGRGRCSRGRFLPPRAPRGKMGKRLGRQAPIEIEAVAAAVERAARLPAAYFGSQIGEIAAADIRRVGNDQVKFLCRWPERAEQIAPEKMYSRRNAVRRRVQPRNAQRGGRNIRGKDLRLRQ